MSTYAAGDIHGHDVALNALLDCVPFRGADTLVFLGDYVDKGPKVKEVLDTLIQLSDRPKTIFIRGNHDQMMLDAFKDPDKFLLWDCLGGRNGLESYGQGPAKSLIKKVPQAHWNFLEFTCRNAFEDEDSIYVHGGIRPHMAPEEEDLERLQWTTLGMALPHESGKTIICGHSSQTNARIADLGHTICIDTGITKGGCLTCLRIDDLTYWQFGQNGNMHQDVLRKAD